MLPSISLLRARSILLLKQLAIVLFAFALLRLGAQAPRCAAQELQVHSFERTELTDTYFSEGVSIGDINGDDVNDVVYGPYWFEGPSFTAKHEIYPAKPQPTERYADNFFSWVYDFDQDGANDVFVVGFPGTPAFVYQNPGNGEGAWKKHQVFDWVSNESPRLIQLVGDERPELVCTRDGFFGFATIDWTKPFTPWTFHAISEKVTATRFGHGLGIGDVNSDGRLDILHSNGWYEQPAEGALNGRWRDHKVKFSSAYGGAEMYAYDVDADGDNDIITSEAAHDFGLSWYEQVSETEFKRHPIMGSHPSENKYGVLFSELHSVNLADIDGDGLLDIVTGKTYWSHHKQSPMWDAGAVVYWFELNRDDGIDWIPHQANGDAGIGRQVVVADIDQDGQLDIATGGMLGANVMIQQRQNATPAEHAAWQPKVYDGPKLRKVEQADPRRGGRAPIGSNGKVVSAIEGENLNASVTGGKAEPQPMGNFSGDRWSGNSQLWWTGGKPGDTLSIEFDAMRDIEAIELALTCARDYGFVQIYLNDKELGKPIDLYNPEVVTTGLLEFKTLVKQGKHKLTFELVGANEKAVKAYMFGLDFVRFRGVGQKFAEPDDGIKPVDANGRVLNLDFETGTLADWTAEGEAFEGQPIQGDTVSVRRSSMSSQHRGDFWIGGFEKLKDGPTGSLTSAPFKVTARFASFLVAGGSTAKTRVELEIVGEEKPFYTVRGREVENLRQVVVDLRRAEGREIRIRLVDESSGGWGHLNFDHFRLHAKRPGPVTPPAVDLVADEYMHQGLAAEAAAAAMKLPQGFKVTVCASEPDVRQPIAMAIDDRGRTWIAEAYEYPQRARGDKGRDQILVFEDTTGDGKFDSRKVFYEGLNLVSGLEVGFGGVWVGAAPYLMFIPDKDGDDVPDAEPEILLDGWGFHDTHETLNAFSWGPDGWLYGCHGVFTHSKVGRPGQSDHQRVPLNAAIWRYHPLKHQFEVFAHGTSNPWGVDFNEHGEAFATACVIPHLYHIFPGARYQRQAGQHFNPHTYDDIKTIADHLHYLGATPHSGNGKSDEVGGGHAHAGAMIYQGGAWPEQYRGALFMNNIHGQRLNMDLLVPEGSGYVGTHGPDFLLTEDLASQILNMRYGPDGQVTMIDWYDMQACHRREVEVHDRSNGRIYKISYEGEDSVESTPILKLAELGDLELAELCLHANDWYVRHSRRILQERAAQRKIAMPAIQRLVEIATTHADDTRRLRALWARHVVGVFDESLFARVLADASPHVRGWGLRLMMEQRNNQLTEVGHQQLLSLAGDASPVVRRAVASAVDQLEVELRWPVVEELVGHAEDADDHNLPLMYWYNMEPLAAQDPDRALALGMKAGAAIPRLRDFMLRRLGGTGGSQAIERLVAGLARTDDAEVQLTFLTAIRSALAGQRTAPTPAAWPELYQRLGSSSNAQVQLTATALGVTFGDKRAMARLSQVVADRQQTTGRRLEAMGALLDAKFQDFDQMLMGLMAAGEEPTELRQAAIRGLAQYERSTIADHVLAQYPRLNASERRAAIATLCGRANSALALLKEIEQKKIPAADLTADLARQLEYLEDESVTDLLSKVWGQVRESSADKKSLMEQYAKLVSNKRMPPADVALGRTLFAKTCQRCHVLYGVGQQLGPDLTGSNRSNLDYLLENIVDPSAVMAKEYRQSIFLTEDGQVITGIVRNETKNAVTIQTAEAVVVLPTTEIAQRKDSDKSMMPDNQLSQFNEHQIRSLITYLRGKSQTPLLATAENAPLFFNGIDLTGWSGNMALWTVENGELVGKSDGLKKNEFLVSDFTARDFHLEFEIKLVGNQGNSGVQFRSKALPNGSVEGYQADVGQGWWGKLYEEHGRALLWDKSGEQHLKPGDWNRYEIEANDSRIQTRINGKLCVDLDDPAGARQGIFALQLHSGGPTEVRFRNFKLSVNDSTQR